MGYVKDLTGQKFGRLTVIKRVENKVTPSGSMLAQFLCRCDCGQQKIILGTNLRRGKSLSCGCTIRKHGQCYTRLYRIHRDMKTRCYNQNVPNYKNYGGRGIKVCNEWLNDFTAFYKWAMVNGYREDLTIDRIDVSKEYSPENCRWVTWREQENNRRNNKFITYNNETHTVKEWARICNLTYNCIRHRLNELNWDIEKALTTPQKK